MPKENWRLLIRYGANTSFFKVFKIGYVYYYFCSTFMPKKDNCNAVDKDRPSDVCRRPYLSFPLKVEIKLDAQTAFSTIISLIVMPLIPIVPQLGMVFTPLNILPCSPTMCLPFTVISRPLFGMRLPYLSVLLPPLLIMICMSISIGQRGEANSQNDSYKD